MQRNLARTSSELGSTFERLSSGLRINRASDDAAGLAVASSLGINKRVFYQGVRNLNDGLSLLNVAEGSLGQLSNIVIRQRELAEQSANGVLSDGQRSALDLEAQSLFEEYERILSSTEFNGQNLLNGTIGSVALQAGFGGNGVLNALIREGETTVGSVTEGLGTYTDNVRSWGANVNVVEAPTFLVGDLNNDGIKDIVALKAVQPVIGTIRTQIAFFLGEDGGTTFTLDDTATFDSTYTGVLTDVSIKANLFDIGGDGDLDLRIFTQVQSTGASPINTGYIQNRTVEDGTFNMNPGLTFQLGMVTANNSATKSGDFNNDGVNDQVTASGADANIRIQDTQTYISTIFEGESLEQSSFSLQTQSSALDALSSLESNLDLINTIVSRIGASQSRIGTSVGVLQVSAENMASAESQITDADVAFESARLIRLNLLQQASAAILAQANNQPAIALSLLS